MSEKYDSTKDTKKHIANVKRHILKLVGILRFRADIHDSSKFEYPEKPLFDEWRPKLNEVIFGSPEYNFALREMGNGLEHHYENNRHHPEHFANGIDGMSLVDVVEMFCDWCAVAHEKKEEINWEYLQERFHISDQLLNIFKNTI